MIVELDLRRGRWRIGIRPGLLLVGANAVGASVIYGSIWELDARLHAQGCSACPRRLARVSIVEWMFFTLALAFAWLAVWAWARHRWPIAALAILLALPISWYGGELSLAIMIGFAFVAVFRWFEERPARRGRRRRQLRDSGPSPAVRTP
jgi:hypothetical protein